MPISACRRVRHCCRAIFAPLGSAERYLLSQAACELKQALCPELWMITSGPAWRAVEPGQRRLAKTDLCSDPSDR